MNETSNQIRCIRRSRDQPSSCPSDLSFDSSVDGYCTLPKNSNVPPFINAPSKVHQ